MNGDPDEGDGPVPVEECLVGGWWSGGMGRIHIRSRSRLCWLKGQYE